MSAQFKIEINEKQILPYVLFQPIPQLLLIIGVIRFTTNLGVPMFK